MWVSLLPTLVIATPSDLCGLTQISKPQNKFWESTSWFFWLVFLYVSRISFLCTFVVWFSAVLEPHMYFSSVLPRFLVPIFLHSLRAIISFYECWLSLAQTGLEKTAEQRCPWVSGGHEWPRSKLFKSLRAFSLASRGPVSITFSKSCIKLQSTQAHIHIEDPQL